MKYKINQDHPQFGEFKEIVDELIRSKKMRFYNNELVGEVYKGYGLDFKNKLVYTDWHPESPVDGYKTLHHPGEVLIALLNDYVEEADGNTTGGG